MSEVAVMDHRQIQILRIEACGLLSLRGSAAVLASGLQSLGLALPDTRRITRAGNVEADQTLEAGETASSATDIGGTSACWMSPDEVLVVLPLEMLTQAKSKLAQALQGQHHLLHDITQGRAVYQLRGPYLRELLAKAAPVDLDPTVFGLDEIRRTRAGQINVAFWLTAEDEAIIIAARSVGSYLETLLRTLARPGSEIGWFDAR